LAVLVEELGWSASNGRQLMRYVSLVSIACAALALYTMRSMLEGGSAALGGGAIHEAYTGLRASPSVECKANR